MESVMEKPRNRAKGSKPGITKARLAFLYGVNGSAPVVSTKELAVIAGASEKAVWLHMASWKEEAEKIAIRDAKEQSGNLLSVSPSSLALDPEVSAKHKHRLTVLDTELDECEHELVNLRSVISEIGSFIRVLNEEDKEYALKLFDNYLRASLNKTAVTKRFLSLQSQWTKMAGLDAMMDIQVTGAKVTASLLAKASLDMGDKTDSNDDLLSVGFKRRG